MLTNLIPETVTITAATTQAATATAPAPATSPSPAARGSSAAHGFGIVAAAAVADIGGVCVVCTTATPVSEWRISKVPSAPTAEPGGPLAYTVTASNTGVADIAGATFTDDLTGVLDDAAVTSVSSTVGSATFTAPNLVWTGDLPVGASATITYVVTVNAPDTGDRQLVNAITSPTAVCVVCATATPVGPSTAPVLAIIKLVDRSPAAAGDLVTYTMFVTNAGATPYAPATVTDNLAGVLDDATFVSASATTGTATVSGTNLVWTGDLAVGATARVTYVVRVNSPGSGDHRLVNAVTSSNAGSLCPGVALCTTDTAVAELHLVKQVDRTTAAPGENVTYTVTASNAGQVALPGATFTDNLAAVLDDATIGTVSATLGTATLSPPTLTWTGDLPIGASAQITYAATITGAGDRVLTNAVVSTSLGTTCPVPTDAGCAVTLTVGPGSTPPPSPSPPVPTGAPGTTPVGPAVPAGPGPVTGLPLAVLVESAVILLVLGSLVLWWARRRRMAGEL